MDIKPNWKPPSNIPKADICLAVANEATTLIDSQMPDISESFPIHKRLVARISLSDGWLGFVLNFKGSGAPQIDKLNGQEFSDLSLAATTSITRDHANLNETLGVEYFNYEKFTYIGPWDEQMVCWPHIVQHLTDWMNSYVIPEVIRRNTSRVLRAIPPPPTYKYNEINKSLWILECEESSQQGTAFFLGEVGIVTCEHVLGKHTMAFQADSIHDKRHVQIIAKNRDIDLAILKIEGEIEGELMKGSADTLSQMDQIAVFGYPNYRVGDTGTITPGTVAGFRPVSGIRRILTNAPIIAGASGAPVLDSSGLVIGVAATGADRMENAFETEHHSIIPIDALNYLV